MENKNSSDEHYRILFTELMDGSIICDGVKDEQGNVINGKIVSVNPAFAAYFNTTADTFEGKTILESFPDINVELFNGIIEAAKTGKPLKEEIFSKVINKNFEVFSFSTKPNQVGILFYDIDDRIHAEQQLKTSLHEKEVMLKEIHHRVKNNLQVISSLLDLQSMSFSDPLIKLAFHDSQNRVRTMAIIHERIYNSPDLANVDLKVFVDELVPFLTTSYREKVKNIKIVKQLDSALLQLDSAIPFGLIINEVLTNVLKHAFPDSREGTVTITLINNGDTILLSIKDDGIGLPKNFNCDTATTLGYQLITALTSQIEGDLKVFGENGTEVTLTIQPLINS